MQLKEPELLEIIQYVSAEHPPDIDMDSVDFERASARQTKSAILGRLLDLIDFSQSAEYVGIPILLSRKTEETSVFWNGKHWEELENWRVRRILKKVLVSEGVPELAVLVVGIKFICENIIERQDWTEHF